MSDTQDLTVKIAERMQNNSILCPLIFDDKGQVYDYIRTGLLNLADFCVTNAKRYFPNLQVQDIALVGGMSSYIYNSKTDIDLVIIATIDAPNSDTKQITTLFQTVNCSNKKRGYIFNLFERYIDYWLAEPSSLISLGCGLYSLRDNCWKKKPIHREFSYTPEEATEAYKKYCDNINNFVRTLPQIDGKWLTFDGCHKLQNYIEQLKREALMAKENGSEQEYGIEYNCYRFFCKFGVKQYFFDLITESQNQLINGLEVEDERNS